MFIFALGAAMFLFIYKANFSLNFLRMLVGSNLIFREFFTRLCEYRSVLDHISVRQMRSLLLKDQKYNGDKNEKKSAVSAIGEKVEEKKLPDEQGIKTQIKKQEWEKRMSAALENSLKSKL